LAILGFALPYHFFTSFLVDFGIDLSLMIDQLFASPISTFFAVDLFITAIVFVIYVFRQAQKRGIKNWWLYILSTFIVGPSFALPLFLFRLEGSPSAGSHLEK
jgi:hypothetical protein